MRGTEWAASEVRSRPPTPSLSKGTPGLVDQHLANQPRTLFREQGGRRGVREARPGGHDVRSEALGRIRFASVDDAALGVPGVAFLGPVVLGDHHDAGACLRGGERRGTARQAAADHEHVDFRVVHGSVPSRLEVQRRCPPTVRSASARRRRSCPRPPRRTPGRCASVIPPDDSIQHSRPEGAPDPGHRLGHAGRRHVVEQHGVHPRGKRLVELLERVHLHLDGQPAGRRRGPRPRRPRMPPQATRWLSLIRTPS